MFFSFVHLNYSIVMNTACKQKPKVAVAVVAQEMLKLVKMGVLQREIGIEVLMRQLVRLYRDS